MHLVKMSIVSVAALALGLPGIASACGNPGEQWYRDVSDVIFEGTAVCQPEKEVCQIRVQRILKNALNLGIDNRRIEVDYQNWYADNYENHPNVIVIACGVRYFQPEEGRFRARFYANLDEASGELVVRRAVQHGMDRD